VLGLHNRELRHIGIEFELHALQEHGVPDAPFGAIPTEHPVAHDELQPLPFARDPTAELSEVLVDLQGRARWKFVPRPLVPHKLPGFESPHSLRIILEAHDPGLTVRVYVVLRLAGTDRTGGSSQPRSSHSAISSGGRGARVVRGRATLTTKSSRGGVPSRNLPAGSGGATN